MKTEINIANLRNIQLIDSHHITAETPDGNKVEFKRRLKEGWMPWFSIRVDGVILHEVDAGEPERAAWNALHETAIQNHLRGIDASRKAALQAAGKVQLFPTTPGKSQRRSQ